MDSKYDKCSMDDSASSESHLLPDSESEPRYQSKRAGRFSKENVFTHLWRIFVVCFALWGVVDVSCRAFHRLRTKPVELCNCGDTLEEAISLGCKYDQMASAWLPPQCRDEELSAKYAKLGNGPDGTWNYWADYNRTTPLTAHEVSMLAGTKQLYYMDWEWHTAHCVYYWEKETRLPKTKVAMEPRFESAHHLDHCREVIFSNRKLTSNAGVVLKGALGKKSGEYSD